ncbi:MAG: SPASM domain-containing protein, partial [Candidatus Aenigmatarchaeota archaeon]
SNGDVYPCFGMFESGSKIGNIRNTNIKDIWYSEMYKNLRYKLLHCNKCVWNCQEELNILFDRVLGRFA